MSFGIKVPDKYTAVEMNVTYNGGLCFSFDNGFLPILAKQVIDEINTADLARLFDGEQIEALKKAISSIELDNEASETGLLK